MCGRVGEVVVISVVGCRVEPPGRRLDADSVVLTVARKSGRYQIRCSLPHALQLFEGIGPTTVQGLAADTNNDIVEHSLAVAI